jgi:NAD(P)-dependent dehydrogenase (short-subunit alcohol dehydrogenase family)
MKNSKVAVVGASGGIGKALVDEISQQQDNQIFTFARNQFESDDSQIKFGYLNYEDEETIQKAAEFASTTGPLDAVIVTTGFLHNHEIKPEKSLAELSTDKLQHNMLINAIGPALVAKHFLPHLKKDKTSLFAVLSARVGSIEDNRLGGWYSYRATKAALNMLIKTSSIEIARKNKKAIIIGLHPGTVDTQLSSPFQSNVPKEKLFSPEYSAQCLLSVMEKLETKDSGKIFAWDGKQIPY